MDVARTRGDQHHRHNSHLPDDRQVVHETNGPKHRGVFQSDVGKIPGLPISDTTVRKIVEESVRSKEFNSSSYNFVHKLLSVYSSSSSSCNEY